MKNNWIECIGCKGNTAWALKQDSWIYRITFSKSLAEHINNLSNGKYQIIKVDIKPGRKLKPGEKSSTGAYALIDSKKDRILRCPLDYNVAKLLCDFNTRYLAEARIRIPKEQNHGEQV